MKYSEETIIEKNITLSFEFERYILENPTILETLPDGAEVVLLPKDDPELYRANLRASKKRLSENQIIYIEIEALAPPRSRLINPRMTRKPSGIASTSHP
jgi:hypothetical protein